MIDSNFVPKHIRKRMAARRGVWWVARDETSRLWFVVVSESRPPQRWITELRGPYANIHNARKAKKTLNEKKPPAGPLPTAQD